MGKGNSELPYLFILILTIASDVLFIVMCSVTSRPETFSQSRKS